MFYGVHIWWRLNVDYVVRCTGSAVELLPPQAFSRLSFHLAVRWGLIALTCLTALETWNLRLIKYYIRVVVKRHWNTGKPSTLPMVARYMVSLFLVLACGEVHVTFFRVVAWYFWCPYSYKLFGLLLHLVQAYYYQQRNTCSCSRLLLICSFFHLALSYFSYECSLIIFFTFS